MIAAPEKLRTNGHGEFVETCVCGSGDFFTVVEDHGVWVEMEPVAQWDGWGCISCNRVFNDEGVRIAWPDEVVWMS